MTRIFLPVCAVLFVLAALPLEADAQVKNRWRLNWHNDKPEIHTHRSPQGKLENYWYFTYDIVNRTDQIVPVIIDVMMYTETGKDLQHGVRKVDRDKIREMNEDPKKSENLLYGRFYSNVIVPESVEYKIIEKDARLANRSQGIVFESIENFKKGDKDGNRWYLNPREMRDSRWIRPGQKFHGNRR